MPGAKQAWPMVAACWSPATPRIGIGRTQDRGLGDAEVGVAVAHLRQQGARNIEEPQQIVVEGALGDVVEQRARGVGGVGGVHLAAGQPPQQEACRWCRRPGRRLARGARALHVVEQPGDLGGREVGIEQQPGLGRDLGSCPPAFSSRHASAVRRSCQTMARWIGWPVRRSQITPVSRWLVMPMAAISPAAQPGGGQRLAAVSTVVRQMSSGSCSTQPEAGKCCANSRWARPMMRRLGAKAMARLEVVP